MKDAIKEVQMLWKLAKIKLFLFSASSLWLSWITATHGLDMTQLKAWEWFQTIGGCFAAWCITMMALIDRTAAQIQAGTIPGLELKAVDEQPAQPAPQPETEIK